MLLTEEVAVIDNLAGKLYLVVYADPTTPEAYTKAKQRLRELRQRLRTTVQPPVTSASVRTETYREFAKDDYLDAVRKAKEYIAAGELMQVQVGQRLTKPFRDNPLSLYRALRSLNPSPYMYYYNFGGDFTWSVRRRKFWCARKSAAKIASSRSGRSPARVRAATRPSAMPNSPPNC